MIGRKVDGWAGRWVCVHVGRKYDHHIWANNTLHQNTVCLSVCLSVCLCLSLSLSVCFSLLLLLLLLKHCCCSVPRRNTLGGTRFNAYVHLTNTVHRGRGLRMCQFFLVPPRHRSSHTPSSENLSPFLEVGYCHARSLSWLQKTVPHANYAACSVLV